MHNNKSQLKKYLFELLGFDNIRSYIPKNTKNFLSSNDLFKFLDATAILVLLIYILSR